MIILKLSMYRKGNDFSSIGFDIGRSRAEEIES